MHTEQDAPADWQRIPPHNLEAEQSVLGGMMLAPAGILDATDHLDHTDFYRPAHTLIYQAILTLHTAGEPADPLTVADQLRKDGNLDRAGHATYLHTCVNTAPTSANTGYYAAIVRNLALLRRVIEAGTSLVQMGYEARQDPEQAAEVVDAAASALQALTKTANGRGESREWLLERILDDVLADYDTPTGDNLPLPWRDMAEKAPMEPGDLVVVAARPAMGKTLVLLEIARHVAIRHGRGALVASMEMSHRQMGQRILVAEADVSLQRFRARELDGNERKAIDKAAVGIFAAPLRIDDTPAVPISKWRARLRQLQAEGQLPAVLIVDYLQIAKAETAAGTNRTGEVDSLASGLKALAQEFGIVVVAAAQLNRQVELRQDKTPTLADLRESGAIEANANIVVLLNRPDYYEPESPRAGEIDLIVAKNRMGTTGVVTCAFQGRKARVVDMPWSGRP